MARTKKYLSKKTNKSGSGFYRPLKRVKSNSDSKVKKVKAPASQIEPKVEKVEDELTKELLEVKKLKQQLEEKISLKKQPQKDPGGLINPQDLSINLFDDIEEDQDNSLNDSRSDLQLPEIESEEDQNIDFYSHDDNEKQELLEKQLEQKSKLEEKAQKEIAKMREEFEKEKKAMQRQLGILRKDMHRQEPIKHNQFFSLSKELGQVVEQMDKLVNSPNFKNPEAVEVEQTQVVEAITPERLDLSGSSLENKIKKTEITIEKQAIPADQELKFQNNKPQSVPEKIEPTTKKKRKVPKIVLVMGTTITIVLVLVGVVWFSINKRSDVSQQLLQEYLPEESVQNSPQENLEKKIDQFVEDAFGLEVEDNDSEDSQVKGDSDQKYAESQADVPFSETYWDTLTDPIMGIELNYPKNTINFIKTETSITFIRKTGYIFKVQVIESALDLPEYWKMIKASSLNYKVKETTFRDQPALFLELEDFAQYPGDKYLVKKDDKIYDIWYATYSNTLDDDDSKRIDIMLNSFKFFE